jgi:hypothetical protein
MKLLEGKSPTEKKKIIAAGILGLIALVALYLAFGRTFFGGSSTAATAKNSPTPRPTAGSSSDRGDVAMPPVSEQNSVYESTPVLYTPGSAFAPDAGRNIFAFYEPPPPCRVNCPSPTPPPVIVKPATPAPTPPIMVNSVNPVTVYAGSRGFRLEVTGERFSPDTRLYFSQSELPTTFINEQKLVADIPANFIAQEGPRQIMAQTTDGKKYSNQVMLNVQAPPKPTVQYIGMIGRKRYNNDTAYFTENEKATPFGARLNDILNNRFRLIAITPSEVTFQDVDLGFKHRVGITRQPGGGMPGAGGKGDDGGFAAPFDPGGIPAGDIPGIPNNIQRFKPGQMGQPGQPSLDGGQKKPPEKKDVDDTDDGDN